jgi:hypothetical protein
MAIGENIGSSVYNFSTEGPIGLGIEILEIYKKIFS